MTRDAKLIQRLEKVERQKNPTKIRNYHRETPNKHKRMKNDNNEMQNNHSETQNNHREAEKDNAWMPVWLHHDGETAPLTVNNLQQFHLNFSCPFFSWPSRIIAPKAGVIHTCLTPLITRASDGLKETLTCWQAALHKSWVLASEAFHPGKRDPPPLTSTHLYYRLGKWAKFPWQQEV